MTLRSQTYILTTRRWSFHGLTHNHIHISNQLLTYHSTGPLPLEFYELSGLIHTLSWMTVGSTPLAHTMAGFHQSVISQIYRGSQVGALET